MEFPFKPVIVALKLPIPELTFKILFDIVGFGFVDQQKPLTVTGELPSLVTFPPDMAEL